MRKFLLTLAVLCGTVSAWAGPTDLPEITTDLENPIYYTISNTRSVSGKLIYWTEGGIKDANYVTNFNACKFYFTGDSYSNLKIHNAATKLLFSGVEGWTEEGVVVEIVETPHSSKAGVAIKFSGTALNERNTGDGYTTWSADDAGSIFVIEKAEYVLPETDKTYFIECPLFHNTQLVMKGLYVNAEGNPVWGTIETANDNHKWQIEVNDEGTAYKNVGTGKYLNGTSMSATAVYGRHDYLGQTQWNIVVNSTTVHANNHNSGSGSGSNIVSWSTGANGASAWQFLPTDVEEAYLAKRYHEHNFPFEFTTDEANPICYAIMSGRGTNAWYTYTSECQIALQDYTGTDAQQWYFKLDDSGYVRLYSKKSEGKAISYENTQNGSAKIYAKSESDNWNSGWYFVRTSGLAPYGLRTYDKNNYLSHNGGFDITDKLGLWNAGPNSDSGTAMYICEPDDVPVFGKFYRIKNNAGTGYLVSGTGEGRTQFEDATVNGINSIFYYNDGKLLSYENGKYLANSNNFLHYTDEVGTSTSVQFFPSKEFGKYAVKFNGNRYLYSNGVGDSNAGSSEGDGNYRFTIEEVTWLPIPVNEDLGYATLYSPVQLELSYGRFKAYAANLNADGTALTLTELDAVPANTAVILELQEGATVENGCSYLQIQESTLSGVETQLQGTLADSYVAGDGYILAKPEGYKTGFYKAAKKYENGTKFLNNGFKAYLPAPVSGARFYVFDFGTETAIENIEGAESANDAVIYDLAGRRVQNALKGLYIVNGKKVIK